MHIYMYIWYKLVLYIYIYIERERDIEKVRLHLWGELINDTPFHQMNILLF